MAGPRKVIVRELELPPGFAEAFPADAQCQRFVAEVVGGRRD